MANDDSTSEYAHQKGGNTRRPSSPFLNVSMANDDSTSEYAHQKELSKYDMHNSKSKTLPYAGPAPTRRETFSTAMPFAASVDNDMYSTVGKNRMNYADKTSRHSDGYIIVSHKSGQSLPPNTRSKKDRLNKIRQGSLEKDNSDSDTMIDEPIYQNTLITEPSAAKDEAHPNNEEHPCLEVLPNSTLITDQQDTKSSVKYDDTETNCEEDPYFEVLPNSTPIPDQGFQTNFKNPKNNKKAQLKEIGQSDGDAVKDELEDYDCPYVSRLPDHQPDNESNNTLDQLYAKSTKSSRVKEVGQPLPGSMQKDLDDYDTTDEVQNDLEDYDNPYEWDLKTYSKSLKKIATSKRADEAPGYAHIVHRQIKTGSVDQQITGSIDQQEVYSDVVHYGASDDDDSSDSDYDEVANIIQLKADQKNVPKEQASKTLVSECDDSGSDPDEDYEDIATLPVEHVHSSGLILKKSTSGRENVASSISLNTNNDEESGPEDDYENTMLSKI